MPKNRRKFRPTRAARRLSSFLRTKCFICLDSPQEQTPKPLPCCRKYVHEGCLLGCFRFAEHAVRDLCPHCRAPLLPYHVSNPSVPLGPNTFCFEWVEYPPPPPPLSDPTWWLDYYGIPATRLECFSETVLLQLVTTYTPHKIVVHAI